MDSDSSTTSGTLHHNDNNIGRGYFNDIRKKDETNKGYAQVDWRLGTVLKGPLENSTAWYSNIVGVLQAQDYRHRSDSKSTENNNSNFSPFAYVDASEIDVAYVDRNRKAFEASLLKSNGIDPEKTDDNDQHQIQNHRHHGSLVIRKEYIYKVPRIPSWRGYWEFLISEVLKNQLPSVKHFARVVDVQPLYLDVDDQGRTLPSVKSNIKHRKERHVMIQKLITGFSLAKQIRIGDVSEQSLFCAMEMVLAALDAAQRIVGFTHFDLHGNNILMKPERAYLRPEKKKASINGERSSKNNNSNYKKQKESKYLTIFHLYDVDTSTPMLIPSNGFRPKIIDYEYSYVRDTKGKPFDSRLDLIHRFYIPCIFDSSLDVLRFLICCCSYMGEKRGSKLCAEIAVELASLANEHPGRGSDFYAATSANKPIRIDPLNGLPDEFPDSVFEDIWSRFPRGPIRYKPILGKNTTTRTTNSNNKNSVTVKQPPLHSGSCPSSFSEIVPDSETPKQQEEESDDSYEGKLRSFVQQRYYYLLGLLLHRVSVPLRQVVDVSNPDSRGSQLDIFSEFLKFVYRSTDVTGSKHSDNFKNHDDTSINNGNDRCCVLLFEYLHSGGDHSVYAEFNHDSVWFEQLAFIIRLASDAIQSLYARHIQLCVSIRKSQIPERFTPLKAIEYLQTKLKVKKEIRDGDVVYWMNKDKRTKYTLSLSPKQEESLNSTYDVFERANKLLRLLNLSSTTE